MQFARKVIEVFKVDKIAHLFHGHFIHRITSLLTDFVNVVYGIRFLDQEITFDIHEAVSEMISSLRKRATEMKRIFSESDEHDEFVKGLVKNISRERHFDAMNMELVPSGGSLRITADKSLFQDMVLVLLEQFALSGIPGAILQSDRVGEGETCLFVKAEDINGGFTLRDSKRRYLRHSVRLAGGEFESVPGGDGESYRYVFRGAR